MEKNQETFSYTYSARQQEEVQSIRQKYLPAQEDKMERLRRLHHSATKKAQVWALVLGVVGALIMGSGMSLVMTDIGKVIGLGNSLLPGIVVGMLGMVTVALAWPVYTRVLTKERQRIAPEIIRLSDELLR